MLDNILCCWCFKYTSKTFLWKKLLWIFWKRVLFLFCFCQGVSPKNHTIMTTNPLRTKYFINGFQSGSNFWEHKHIFQISIYSHSTHTHTHPNTHTPTTHTHPPHTRLLWSPSFFYSSSFSLVLLLYLRLTTGKNEK